MLDYMLVEVCIFSDAFKVQTLSINIIFYSPLLLLSIINRCTEDGR